MISPEGARYGRGEAGGKMIVKLLRVTIYAVDGPGYWAEDITDPTWGDIEAAIRRLDRDRFPFVWLFREACAEEDALYDCSVLGGEGAYAVDCRTDGMWYRYRGAPDAGGEVVLWRSDQGYTAATRGVCRDIETVLRAVRYFCAQGRPDPRLTWQCDPLVG